MKNNRVQDQGNGHWQDHGSKGQEAKKRSTDINRNLQIVVGTGKLRQLPPPPSPPFDQFRRFHFQGSYGIMHLARAIKSNELGSVWVSSIRIQWLYVVIIAIFLALQGRCCAEDKYPMLSDKKRYTPLMLHLARALGVSHTLTVAPGKN